MGLRTSQLTSLSFSFSNCRTIEGTRLRWDDKVLRTCTGTKAAVAPGPDPAAGSLQEKQISISFPYQSREDSPAPGGTWMLEVVGENKYEVGDAQRHCSSTGLWTPASSVPEKLGSWVTLGEGRRVGPCQTLTWIVSSLVRKLGCMKSQELVKNGRLKYEEHIQQKKKANKI